MKQIIGVIVTVCASVACIVGYAVTHETIPAGYVGYVYDRAYRQNFNQPLYTGSYYISYNNRLKELDRHRRGR